MKRLRGFLLAIILCGVVLRFAYLERKLFWFDEVFTAIRVYGYDEHDEIQPRLYTGKIVSVDDIQAFQRPSPGKTVIDTVRGLARKEPVESPGFFVLARWATELFGSAVFATRFVSAGFSSLALLGMYWFAMELFADSLIACAAAALMGVSPMFIHYAHEGRPYAMWVLCITLMGAALLRALRLRTVQSWALYALILTISLYTHLLSILVIACFVVYMILVPTGKTEKLRFVLASAAAMAMFTPWLVVLFIKRKVAMAVMAYTAQHKDFGFLFTRWSLDFSHVFFEGPEALVYVTAVLAAALVAVAFYFLIRKTGRPVWAMPAMLATIPAAAVLAPDLLFGGSRSIHPRYFFPAMIGAELAVAYLLAEKPRWLKLVPLCALLIAGLITSAILVQSPSWEPSDPVDQDMIDLFNASPGTLVVTDLPYGVIAPLTYRLHPNVRFLLTKDPSHLEIPNGFQEIYVYQPGTGLKAMLEDRYGGAMRLIYWKARWEQTIYLLYELVPGVK